jgi:hypothetical protein
MRRLRHQPMPLRRWTHLSTERNSRCSWHLREAGRWTTFLRTHLQPVRERHLLRYEVLRKRGVVRHELGRSDLQVRQPGGVHQAGYLSAVRTRGRVRLRRCVLLHQLSAVVADQGTVQWPATRSHGFPAGQSMSVVHPHDDSAGSIVAMHRLPNGLAAHSVSAWHPQNFCVAPCEQ